MTKPKGVTKKGKDPNAPKRAMSAFFLWMQENRDRLKKPGMSVADVAKAAGTFRASSSSIRPAAPTPTWRSTGH